MVVLEPSAGGRHAHRLGLEIGLRLGNRRALRLDSGTLEGDCLLLGDKGGPRNVELGARGGHRVPVGQDQAGLLLQLEDSLSDLLELDRSSLLDQCERILIGNHRLPLSSKRLTHPRELGAQRLLA